MGYQLSSSTYLLRCRGAAGAAWGGVAGALKQQLERMRQYHHHAQFCQAISPTGSLQTPER